MKLGFIGVGNMAKAIIEGLLAAGKVAPADIYIHSAHAANYESYAAEKGLTACKDNTAVALEADYVFLAVKPLTAGEVLREIADYLVEAKPVVVSMVSGVSLAELTDFIGAPEVEVVRIMPNVNVAISEGMTAMVANDAVSDEHYQELTAVLNQLGQTTNLPEADFSTFVALAGSSPAFVYFYIDSMAKAGVKYGLKKDQAVQVAAQAVLGSAKNVLQSSKSPMDLVDDVCSPGGTTIAGLLAMEEAGFMRSVVRGIDATIAKDQE